jgi:hypothetical protein
MEQVLEIALSRKPEAMEWEEPAIAKPEPAAQPQVQQDVGLTAH